MSRWQIGLSQEQCEKALSLLHWRVWDAVNTQPHLNGGHKRQRLEGSPVQTGSTSILHASCKFIFQLTISKGASTPHPRIFLYYFQVYKFSMYITPEWTNNNFFIALIVNKEIKSRKIAQLRGPLNTSLAPN